MSYTITLPHHDIEVVFSNKKYCNVVTLLEETLEYTFSFDFLKNKCWKNQWEQLCKIYKTAWGFFNDFKGVVCYTLVAIVKSIFCNA